MSWRIRRWHSVLNMRNSKQRRKQLQMRAHTCLPTYSNTRARIFCVCFVGGLVKHSKVSGSQMFQGFLLNFFFCFFVYAMLWLLSLYFLLWFSPSWRVKLLPPHLTVRSTALFLGFCVFLFFFLFLRRIPRPAPSSFDAKHFRSSSHNLMQILLPRPIRQIRFSVGTTAGSEK